jgi:Animal haem peroxidase
LIGDPRNDENTIVAQLHVAFLKAHNRLVDEGRSFRQAQRILRQHYQHLVIHDFLKRVADPQIVDDILQHPNHPKRVYDALAEPFFLPLEYSFAAYRFGHSMVRAAYNFNLNFNFSGEPGTIRATLELLFTFTALSGQLGFGPATDTLPENWIIEWENLVDQGTGARFDKARLIDTKLVEPLFGLRNFKGEVATVPGEADPGHPEPGDAASLAIRNLLRGYLLRLPTGQAVARALELPALTPAEIEAVASQVQAPAGVEAQADVLREAGFLERTPLWYYVLAEAAHGGGQHLGPVGSTIVAEVLIGLVRRSRDSILRFTNRRRPVAGAIADRLAWRPSLPSAQPGTFTLADLLRFARVLP